MYLMIADIYIYIYIYIYTHSRVSQKFCNIFLMWGLIQWLQMFLPKVVKVTNHTGLLPGTLQVRLTEFSSMAWSTVTGSMVQGWPDLAQSVRFFIQLSSHCDQQHLHFLNNMFLLVFMVSLLSPNSWNMNSHIRLCCRFSFVTFKSCKHSEAMHNMPMHQLPLYY